MTRRRWHGFAPGRALALLVIVAPTLTPASAQPLIPAPQPRRLPPPSSALLRSLEGFQHDLQLLDRSLLNGSVGPDVPGSAAADGAASPTLPAPVLPAPVLPAPAATALPTTPEAVRIERRQRLSLSQALAQEWELIGFAAYRSVATPQGRSAFLRSIEFSSPSAGVLGAAQRVRQQLADAAGEEAQA